MSILPALNKVFLTHMQKDSTPSPSKVIIHQFNVHELNLE